MPPRALSAWSRVTQSGTFVIVLQVSGGRDFIHSKCVEDEKVQRS